MLTQPCAGEMYTLFRPGEVISNVLVSLYANSYGNLTGCSLWSAKSEMPTLASIDNRCGRGKSGGERESSGRSVVLLGWFCFRAHLYSR